MMGPDEDDHGKPKGDAVEHFVVLEGKPLVFPLRTADRREWQVEVDWETLEALAGRPGATRADVERALVRRAHHLEFAALRLIARRAFSGDRVLLTVSSLGV
ncbi:MAG: hypothetical protein V4472_14545 [Pseudomonadota bacterium]